MGAIASKPAPTLELWCFGLCFKPPGDVLSHSLAFSAH
ncbi:hypothetical protein UCMB321_0848 [Pseudomonas batumici]|uniref:Uncharacterized protein n=1 Tax=Pseudomonas batumici TaxID=226910 RepID=A0A0C2EH47_9PSED|nr:hypothetical protein UCMB321_0848 [Pseudomonas batumici]